MRDCLSALCLRKGAGTVKWMLSYVGSVYMSWSKDSRQFAGRCTCAEPTLVCKCQLPSPCHKLKTSPCFPCVLVGNVSVCMRVCVCCVSLFDLTSLCWTNCDGWRTEGKAGQDEEVASSLTLFLYSVDYKHRWIFFIPSELTGVRFFQQGLSITCWI